LQAVVILDGGISSVGVALGAAFWIWRHQRAASAPPWQRVADIIAVGVLTALLFERAGCALTTCGSGPASALLWAMLRGNEWQMPLALAQVGVLAGALTVAVETLRRRGSAFVMALAALILVALVELLAGRPVFEQMLTLGVLAASYGVPWAAASRKHRVRE
jgi:hypothetical protein